MISGSRWAFLRNSFLASLSFIIAQSCKQSLIKKPAILIVSGWQDVNIGDIAHTPGMLHVLKTFIPNVDIILWKSSESKRVDTLISDNFPMVKIIHGFGSYIVGKSHLETWNKYSSKPFGIFGTTIEQANDYQYTLL